MANNITYVPIRVFDFPKYTMNRKRFKIFAEKCKSKNGTEKRVYIPPDLVMCSVNIAIANPIPELTLDDTSQENENNDFNNRVNHTHPLTSTASYLDADLLSDILATLSFTNNVIAESFRAYCDKLPHGYYSTHDNCTHYATSVVNRHEFPKMDDRSRDPICCPQEEFSSSHTSRMELYRVAEFLKKYAALLEEVAFLEDRKICFVATLRGVRCVYRRHDSCYRGNVNKSSVHYFLCTIMEAVRNLRQVIRLMTSLNTCICDDDPASRRIRATRNRLNRTLAVLHVTKHAINTTHNIIAMRRILVETGSAL